MVVLKFQGYKQPEPVHIVVLLLFAEDNHQIYGKCIFIIS